jgi:hypothetical protein
VLVDPETANAGFQRAGRNAECLSRAVGAVHPAAAGHQRLLDLLALVARIIPPRANGFGSEARKLEIRQAEDGASSEDHRALDDVLQLADVARPRVRAQP